MSIDMTSGISLRLVHLDTSFPFSSFLPSFLSFTRRWHARGDLVRGKSVRFRRHWLLPLLYIFSSSHLLHSPAMVTVFPLFHHNKDSVTTLAAMPTSPLPDTSALEAGIIQDERPSRLSRVQDNVRNLLRTSVFGSVASSPTTPARPVTGRNRPGAFSPIVIPTSPPAQIQPGPLSSVSTPTHYTSSPLEIPPPAATYQTAGQANGSTHYQSTLFNGRAVAALNHPDLSDLSVESLSQQKAHQQQRSGSGSRRSQKQSHRGRRTAKKAACSRVLLCVLAALLLGALVATCKSVHSRSYAAPKRYQREQHC